MARARYCYSQECVSACILSHVTQKISSPVSSRRVAAQKEFKYDAIDYVHITTTRRYRIFEIMGVEVMKFSSLVTFTASIES